MSDPIFRTAQWVIDAKKQKYNTECNWPMQDKYCSYEDTKSIEACKAKFINLNNFAGFPKIPDGIKL